MKYEQGSFMTVGSRDTLRGLHPTAQCLYMWLSSYANETGNCFPSRKTLAKDCGCSEDTVDKMLVLLGENGLVLKKNRIENGEKLSNLYTVLIVGSSRTQRLPSPPETATLPARNGINSIQLTKKENAVAKAPVLTIIEVQEIQEKPRAKKELDSFEVNYEELCRWAESRRGGKFVSRVKQYSALKTARTMGIGPSKLKSRWTELESEDWYIEHGLDWKSVISSFDKKP